jgi:hypothetical protein
MADTLNYGNVHGKRLGQASVIARVLLFAFVIVCVFDPADRILGAKVWLFVALWGATCVVCLLSSDQVRLPAGLLLLVLLFIAIPLLSIFWYYLANGTQPYAGFDLLKAYLLVSVAIVLVVNRTDLMPFLSGALTVLALLTIAISIALHFYPMPLLYSFGERYGVLILGERTYGEGLTFNQVFFVTSPMLAISIAYYFDRTMSESDVGSKLVHLGLTAISISGMFLVGLRNTMAVALLLPLFLWPLYTRRVALNGLISLGALIILSLPFIKRLAGLLNPAEVSNNIKLTFLGDYAAIFSNPVTLLFGQGLGAYHRWGAAGQLGFEKTGANYYFITELTYAEMIRSFGLLGAAITMALLLFPIAQAFFVSADRRRRALAVGFLAYLGMCLTNPMLFSSLGMLIFSALLANAFQTSDFSQS